MLGAGAVRYSAARPQCGAAHSGGALGSTSSRPPAASSALCACRSPTKARQSALPVRFDSWARQSVGSIRWVPSLSAAFVARRTRAYRLDFAMLCSIRCGDVLDVFCQSLHCVALCCLCIYLSGMAIFTQRGEKVATIGVHSGVRVRLAGGAAVADGAAGAFTVEWGEESCREALEFRRVARAGCPQRPAPARTQPW